MKNSIVVNGADFSAISLYNINTVGWEEIKLSNRGLITPNETYTNTGCITSNAIATRCVSIKNISDVMYKVGIFLKAGDSMILKGLRGLTASVEPLRVDYCYYSTSSTYIQHRTPDDTTKAPNVINSYSAENDLPAYPLNAELNDSIEITNTYEYDAYFIFGFAGKTLSEDIDVDNYSIQYKILSQEYNWDKLPLMIGGVNLTQEGGGNIILPSSTITRLCSSINGGVILLKEGQRFHIKGLRGKDGSVLRMDAAYYSSSDVKIGDNSSIFLGTLSNFVSSNYYPSNYSGDSDDRIISNPSNVDRYYVFAFAANNLTSELDIRNYDLEYYIE